MPSGATGGALSGAAQGAAAGTAILPGWGTAIGAVVGGIGGYLSGSGTADAQKEANRVAAQQAASKSAQDFFNYLASRGVDLQRLAGAHPELKNAYDSLADKGGRSFQVWLYDHLKDNPSDALWDEISSPKGAGASNTTLPAWAVDANGNALQPSLLQQIVNQYTKQTADPAQIEKDATAALEQSVPGIVQRYQEHVAAGYTGTLADEIRQFYADTGTRVAPWDQAYLSAMDQAAQLRATLPASTAGTSSAPPGSPGVGNNQTLDPAIAALIPKSTDTVNGILDGTLLNQQLAGLKPVQDARTAIAAAQAAKIDELRGLSGSLLDTELGGIGNVLTARTAGAGGIYDATIAGAGGVRDASKAAANAVNEANITKLADLLGVRRDAAEQIYNASLGAAGGVRDARTTGANNIYGAELLRADTYDMAAKQALSRLLAQQSAERLRQGFTGGSSGSDIVRARLNADYLQRGAGERAGAGVNLQTRLSDAGIGYAQDTGKASIGRATTLGQASEQDAIAKLNAAVDLARSLGLADTNFATTSANAGVGKATSLASAGEQNAIAQLQARVADAQRRLGYLTSDADIAKATADLQNAQDALTAVLTDQNRKTGSIGAPFTLAGSDLALKGDLTNQQYTDMDALLKRLQSFTLSPATGPTTTQPNVQPVLNSSQIAGGALSSLGSIIGNTANNGSLADIIKAIGSMGGSSNTTNSGVATVTPSNSSLLSSPNFLANASVFGAG